MGFIELLRTMRSKPSQKAGRFVLRYVPADGDPVTVGDLELLDGVWTFKYHDEYKSRPDLRPIEGFDETDRVYKSTVLFPFFAVRIPDIGRQDVRLRLAQAKVSDPDTTDLLRIFGRRVVSSPAFELVPVG